ncbi:hypothetical protein [Pantoea sp. y20]
MDFTKYVSLISSSALYFARSDTFEDVFEGAKGYEKNKGKWDSYYLNFFRGVVTNLPDGVKSTLSTDEIESQANKIFNEMNEGSLRARKRTFISCWHENEHESEAMWRLYSKVWDNAIAIKTSYGSLYKALGSDYSISIGRVEYIDLRKNYAGINEAFWRKRKSFEHEREVRAIKYEDQSFERNGLSLSCDLNLLIEDVFISPKAPEWFRGLVNEINKKYSVTARVSPSELDETPFF